MLILAIQAKQPIHFSGLIPRKDRIDLSDECLLAFAKLRPEQLDFPDVRKRQIPILQGEIEKLPKDQQGIAKLIYMIDTLAAARNGHVLTRNQNAVLETALLPPTKAKNKELRIRQGLKFLARHFETEIIGSKPECFTQANAVMAFLSASSVTPSLDCAKFYHIIDPALSTNAKISKTTQALVSAADFFNRVSLGKRFPACEIMGLPPQKLPSDSELMAIKALCVLGFTRPYNANRHGGGYLLSSGVQSNAIKALLRPHLHNLGPRSRQQGYTATLNANSVHPLMPVSRAIGKSPLASSATNNNAAGAIASQDQQYKLLAGVLLGDYTHGGRFTLEELRQVLERTEGKPLPNCRGVQIKLGAMLHDPRLQALLSQQKLRVKEYVPPKIGQGKGKGTKKPLLARLGLKKLPPVLKQYYLEPTR